jgi:hypothetical protein
MYLSLRELLIWTHQRQFRLKSTKTIISGAATNLPLFQPGPFWLVGQKHSKLNILLILKAAVGDLPKLLMAVVLHIYFTADDGLLLL